MIDALRPTTLSTAVHPPVDRTVVRPDTQAAPATKSDGLHLSHTAKPGLRPIPLAVAAQLHAVPAKTPHPSTQDEPLPVAPLTLESALNPLDRTSIVGQYVTGLAELSGTPAKTARWLLTVGDDLKDPTLSTTDRVVLVRKHTQATAKLLYTATALPAMWSGAAAVLPTWLYGGKFATQASQCHRILTSVMNVARPIGDGLLFIGDAANLKQKIQDPKATAGQLGRATVDVALDTTRLIAYALPQTGPVKGVASAALFLRTGLGIYDMVHHHSS